MRLPRSSWLPSSRSAKYRSAGGDLVVLVVQIDRRRPDRRRFRVRQPARLSLSRRDRTAHTRRCAHAGSTSALQWMEMKRSLPPRAPSRCARAGRRNSHHRGQHRAHAGLVIDEACQPAGDGQRHILFLQAMRPWAGSSPPWRHRPRSRSAWRAVACPARDRSRDQRRIADFRARGFGRRRGGVVIAGDRNRRLGAAVAGEGTGWAAAVTCGFDAYPHPAWPRAARAVPAG